MTQTQARFVSESDGSSMEKLQPFQWRENRRGDGLPTVAGKRGRRRWLLLPEIGTEQNISPGQCLGGRRFDRFCDFLYYYYYYFKLKD